ncbi:hypothetical protein A0H81_12007 [Grifola frondosa]|uniref:Uncharacterized protein n=1 Tax=Grifola frondosa TaxID=5627 RepID=A0A1C7LUB8_GRIFR|nr:hypothetical protein A0H81_12007 [Grifola frondosa]
MSVHKSEKVEAAEDAPGSPPPASTFTLAQLLAAIELIREQEEVAAQVAATQVAAASSTASVENVGPSRCDNRDGDGVASDDSDEELYWRDDPDATPAAPVAAGPAPVAPAGPAAGALVVPGPTNIITATPTTSTLVGDTPPAYTAAAPPPACPPACPPAGPPTGPPLALLLALPLASAQLTLTPAGTPLPEELKWASSRDGMFLFADSFFTNIDQSKGFKPVPT